MKKIFTDFKIIKMGRARLGKDDSEWIVYTHRMKSLQVKVLLYFLTHDMKAMPSRVRLCPHHSIDTSPHFKPS